MLKTRNIITAGVGGAYLVVWLVGFLLFRTVTPGHLSLLSSTLTPAHFSPVFYTVVGPSSFLLLLLLLTSVALAWYRWYGAAILGTAGCLGGIFVVQYLMWGSEIIIRVWHDWIRDDSMVLTLWLGSTISCMLVGLVVDMLRRKKFHPKAAVPQS